MADAATVSAISSRKPVATALALVALVLAGYGLLVMPVASGADLAPLMVAARLIARGAGADLYAHDPGYIDIFDAHAWVAAADSIGYGVDGRYYAYLYPPLWAALLAPLTCRVPFSAVFWIAGGLNLAAVGVSLVIAAAQWNRAALRPLPLTLCLVALCASYPLFKTVLLGQIQPLVVLLVVVAISASQNGRPRLAGSALAVAAAIKIVPALIAVYWLWNGRRAAAAWFGIAGAVLAGASIGLAGWRANVDFVGALMDVSRGYAAGLDNQSLIAWLGETLHGTEKVNTILIRTVPHWVRAFVGVFAASCIVGLIRSAPREKAAEALALFSVFLVATLAAPLAWLHYFFALAVPLLVLVRNAPMRLCALAIASLLSLPVVLAVIESDTGDRSILSWGGTIAALSVLVLSAIQIRQSARGALAPATPAAASGT